MSGWGPSEVRYTLYPGAPYVVAPARRGLRFSREELQHILLACGALIFAFTMSFLGLFFHPVLPSASTVVLILVASTVAVLTGFLLHELMHKVVAQRYGAWAEFRSSRTGLMFAVITGLFGIVFAAPGAVYISGPLDRERNGRVSLAGPLTNLALGVGFLAAALAVEPFPASDLMVYLWSVFALTAYINVFLGGFNMLPVPPLDGSKVFAWNKGIWVAAIASIAAVFGVGLYLGVFFF